MCGPINQNYYRRHFRRSHVHRAVYTVCDLSSISCLAGFKAYITIAIRVQFDSSLTIYTYNSSSYAWAFYTRQGECMCCVCVYHRYRYNVYWSIYIYGIYGVYNTVQHSKKITSFIFCRTRKRSLDRVEWVSNRKAHVWNTLKLVLVLQISDD